MQSNNTIHPLYLHFQELPFSIRILYTGVLAVLGLGYAMSMVYVIDSHAMRDGEPMLTAEDMRIAYSGSDADTRLEAALRGGPMKNMAPPEDKLKIFQWVHNGATEAEFNDKIKPILEQRCLACHSGENPHIPVLKGFDNVRTLVKIDEGMTISTLVRVSHIHLLGITFIFLITGQIFGHAYVRPLLLKYVVMGAPFVALIFDVASWYLTKVHPAFAWVVVSSGFVVGAAFAFQWIVSMYQMWLYKLPEEVAKRHTDANNRLIG
jgi:hypothetical protein